MLYTKPWKHDVIDNFFDEATHEYCIEYLQSFRKRQNTHTVVKDKKLLSYFDNIFTEEYLKTNFPQHRPYKYLESVAEVNICTDEFYYGLHDEAIYKIFSVNSIKFLLNQVLNQLKFLMYSCSEREPS